MPIDEELLGTARAIHNEMMAAGLVDQACAIRYAVDVALAEQDEEEQFGTDRISACIGAMATLRSSLSRLAELRPVTAGDVSSILKSSIPQIGLMVEAEGGPTWLRNMVLPVNDAVRRLVSELQRDDPMGKLGSGGQLRLVECVSSLAMFRAGQNTVPNQR